MLRLHTKRVNLTVPSGVRPTIEFDHSVMAWYVRFRKAKVAKTISDNSPGPIHTIDLDEHNKVIGVEILGVPEFTIESVRKIRSLDTSKVNFDKARCVQAGHYEEVKA